MRHKYIGITMIELMVTISLMLIMTGFMSVSFRNYSNRSKVILYLQNIKVLQLKVETEYMRTGVVGNFTLDTNLFALNERVEAISMNASGVLTVKIVDENPRLDCFEITLTPSANNDGNVQWACNLQGLQIDSKYVPKYCTFSTSLPGSC